MTTSFVASVLNTMVRLDAQALVLVDGSIPVMSGAGGNRQVGTRSLPREVVVALLKALLPLEIQFALDDVGAINFNVPERPEAPGERFTVMATVGAKLRVEIRRQRRDETLELPSSEALWPDRKQRRAS